MPGLDLITELPGHTEPAWCVAWNPTRPLLASCSTDKTVRLYSYHFPAHTSTVDDIGFSSRSVKPIFQFLAQIPTAHKRTIRSIAWSPSGRTLATASFDSTVGVWEEVIDAAEGIDGAEHTDDEDGDVNIGSRGPTEWECVTTLEGHESECKSVGYSSDGALLASCSRDKSVWVWEVQPDSDFECISVMMEHTQDVKALAWHPREEILASASYDASILLFADDTDADWGPFQKLQPSLPALIPEVVPDLVDHPSRPARAGETERKNSADGETPDNYEFVIPPLKEPETIWSLAFSPCGMFLASGGDNGGIRIWARGGHSTEARWTEAAHYQAHQPRACFSLSWTGSMASDEQDLGRLASTGGDGRILIWKVGKTDETILTTHLSSPVPKVEMTVLAIQVQAHSILDINSIAWCSRLVPEDAEESSARYKRAELAQERTRGLLATAADDGSVRVWMSEV
ncbi:Cytosolic iron-sulfur protein assembly protein [Naganishia albida]|nr:Cytosolic iron-sulfur protein assembly protein [Naganishia albida]